MARPPRRCLNRFLPLKFPDIILILSAPSEPFDRAETAPLEAGTVYGH